MDSANENDPKDIGKCKCETFNLVQQGKRLVYLAILKTLSMLRQTV